MELYEQGRIGRRWRHRSEAQREDRAAGERAGFLEESTGTLSCPTRNCLVQAGVRRGQPELVRQPLGASRSTLHYRPHGPSAAELAPMWRIEKLYKAHPCYGSRQTSRHPQREGWTAGRRRVWRPTRKTGL